MNEEHKELTPKEIYDIEKKEKKEVKEQEYGKERLKEKITTAPKKIGKYMFYAIAVVGVMSGIAWLVSIAPNLPPTVQENHIESAPSAHIVTTSIPDNIQRHMLEHADGSGSPGVIIQYNCSDYECEPDLVQKLTALVEEYPENVYLAPNNYDGKIILTRLGKRKVLNGFYEQIIRDFIE